MTQQHNYCTVAPGLTEYLHCPYCCALGRLLSSLFLTLLGQDILTGITHVPSARARCNWHSTWVTITQSVYCVTDNISSIRWLLHLHKCSSQYCVMQPSLGWATCRQSLLTLPIFTCAHHNTVSCSLHGTSQTGQHRLSADGWLDTSLLM